MRFLPTTALRRFSLRSLFILMTLCCLVVGTWSVYVNPYRMQLHALAVVNQHEGRVAKTIPNDAPAWQRWLVTKFLGDDAYFHATAVDLNNSDIDDAAFATLADLKHLQTISLDRTKVTDVGVRTLRAMPELKYVSLRYTAVGDETAATLAALPHLESAVLTGTKLTDAAVDNLIQRASLRELSIRWTQMTNAGADRLRKALPQCEVNFHALQPL